MAAVTEERLRLVIDAEVAKALANIKLTRAEISKLTGAAADIKAGGADDLGRAFGSLKAKTVDVLNPINALKGALPALAFGAVAKGVFDTASAFESARKQFGILLQDADKGNQVFDQLLQFNAQTPFGQGVLNSVATQLLNARVPAEQLLPTIAKLGDLSKGSEEKLATLAEVYGRIGLKGKASMEELNRVLESGVPITTALAQVMGVSEQKVFDLVQNGQVGFDAVRAAVDKLTGAGGQYNGMMATMAKTTAGMTSTASGNIEILAGTVGEDLDTATKAGLTGFIDLTNAAAGLLDASKPLIRAFSDLVGGLLLVPLEGTAAILTGISDGLYVLSGNAAKTSAAVKDVKAAVDGTNTAWTSNLKVYQDLSGKQTRTATEAAQLRTAYGNLKALLPGVTDETLKYAAATGNVAAAMKLQEAAAKITELRAQIKLQTPDADAALQNYLQKLRGQLNRNQNRDILTAPVMLDITPDTVKYMSASAQSAFKHMKGTVHVNLFDLISQDNLSDSDMMEVLTANLDALSKSGTALQGPLANVLGLVKARHDLADQTRLAAQTEAEFKASLNATSGAIEPLALPEPTDQEKWTAALKTYQAAITEADQANKNQLLSLKGMKDAQNEAAKSFVGTVAGLKSLSVEQVRTVQDVLAGIDDGTVTFDKAMTTYLLKLHEAVDVNARLGAGADDLTDRENQAAQAFLDQVQSLGNLTFEQLATIRALAAALHEAANAGKSVTQTFIDDMAKLGDGGKIVGAILAQVLSKDTLKRLDDFVGKYSQGFQALFGQIASFAQTAADVATEESNRALQAQIDALERAKQSYEDNSTRQIEIMEAQGQSTVDARIAQGNEEERLQAEIDKKKDKLARQQFDQDKQTKLAQIAMATALGVANTLSAGALAIPLTVGVIALGAAQAAIVAGQQYPAAYDGALIQGSADGSILRAGERGQSELVLPLRAQKLAELGIGGSSVSIGQFNVYSNADPAEVARQVRQQFDLWARTGKAA